MGTWNRNIGRKIWLFNPLRKLVGGPYKSTKSNHVSNQMCFGSLNPSLGRPVNYQQEMLHETAASSSRRYSRSGSTQEVMQGFDFLHKIRFQPEISLQDIDRELYILTSPTHKKA